LDLINLLRCSNLMQALILCIHLCFG